MIRYALTCEEAHSFESWFRDSEAFDVQARRGFVVCPVCGSAKVGKAMMAPAIATRRGAAASEAASLPEPLLDDHEIKMRALARQMREHILLHSDNVGTKFPDQARAMHEGTMEPRPIMGEASLAQVRELMDDGVPIMPVPGAAEGGH